VDRGRQVRSTFDVRFSRAKPVIVDVAWVALDMACLRGRVRHRGQDIQTRGCPERLDLKFIRWVWRYPVDSRPRLDRAIDRLRELLNIVELDATAAAQTFLYDLT
jgi:hypothetical protein